MFLWNAAQRGGGGGNPVQTNIAAWFKYGQGITVTGAGVSQWGDASGNSRHLLQGTDTNRPVLQGDNSILFDGVDNYLKTAPFTLNQPTTVYLVVKQRTWTTNNRLLDGDAGNSGTLIQDTIAVSDHAFHAYAGGYVLDNDDLAIDTWGVVCVVFNGANSLTQVNLNAPVAGDVGAANMGGLTLAAKGDGTVPSNSQFKEVIAYSVAHDAPTRALVISHLTQIAALTLMVFMGGGGLLFMDGSGFEFVGGA